jgi:UDP-2,3-diacylglucosamine hydrolase
VAPPWPVLPAPPAWHQIDFISDLHLRASATATFSSWRRYLQSTPADALFILGDLFDVWVGDDVLNSAAEPNFESDCAQVLKAAASRLAVFLIHGNRDFLLGSAFAKTAGLTLLHDPSVLQFAGQRWLLSHGDALCLADTDYLQFRAQVRGGAWQNEFLEQPLEQRQETALSWRQQSEKHKRERAAFVDLDAQTSCDWLRAAQADTLIHGHTHKPAEHTLAPGLRRIVLSDWDAVATPPRAEVLRLSATSTGPTQACTIQRLSVV